MIKIDKRLKPDSPRAVAEREGMIHFVSDRPCKRGHIGLHYTKGGTCVQCIELNRNRTIDTRGRSNVNIELSKEAIREGRSTYVPEEPCKYGHKLRFVRSNNCVECDKLMRVKHKGSQKFSRIKKEYGLTKEQYLELVVSHNSSCKLCDKYEQDHFKLHIDHCHNTKIVRGLLCGKCNQGIGLLNHDPELLRLAALYCEVL